MATAVKTKKTAPAPAKKATAATKAAPAKKAAAKPAAAPVKAAKPVKAPAKAVKAVKAAAPAKAPAKAPAANKPVKTAFNKSGLIAHVAEVAGVEPKAAKAVIGALEATVLSSVSKKGLGAFTLPGLLKVTVVNVPAKKKRTGIDPFTKQERVFAAKPATVKIKTRALKKLKDAAL
jgi:nucleoid DNA-binding protein